jgi:hypothetical protein
MEIYNTHADAEASRAEWEPEGTGSSGLARWLGLFEAAQRYPAELFATIFHPPSANLAVWDRLNRSRHVVGIAGNDSHQNVGVTVRGGEGDRLEVVDALGEMVAHLKRSELPPLLGLEPIPGQDLLKVRLDPYDVSFGYVSTHLMTHSVTEKDCFEALLHGRCYVAFDWLAGPTGFRYTARSDRRQLEMGDETTRQELSLRVESPIPAELRLIRDGGEIAREAGTSIERRIDQPGVYRAEAWLTVDGEVRPWIYSNPIYVRHR